MSRPENVLGQAAPPPEVVAAITAALAVYMESSPENYRITGIAPVGSPANMWVMAARLDQQAVRLRMFEGRWRR